MSSGILDMDGFEATLVLLPVLDHTNTSPVPATGHHDNIPYVELDEVNNLVGFKVELDGVISLDKRVWVADGAAIIGVKIGNALLSKLHRTNLAELELQKVEEKNKILSHPRAMRMQDNSHFGFL